MDDVAATGAAHAVRAAAGSVHPSAPPPVLLAAFALSVCARLQGGSAGEAPKTVEEEADGTPQARTSLC